MTNPLYAVEAPDGLQRIVAWEWRIPPQQVRAWPYLDFYAALSVLTESRYTVIRAKSREHNAAADKFRASLPR